MTRRIYYNRNSKTKAVLLGLIYLSTLFGKFNIIGNVSFITLFTGLFCILVFIERIHTGKIKFSTRDKAILCCVLLIILTRLSILWSNNKPVTISRNYAYTILPFYFICVEMTTIDEKHLDTVDNLIILSGFIFFLYALLTQGISGLTSGRFAITADTDQNATCACLFLVLVVSFKQIQKRIKLSKTIAFQIVSFGMTAFLFLLTGSRGGLVALAAWILIKSLEKKRRRFFRIVVISILILSVVYVIAPVVLPDYVYLRLFTRDSYMATVVSEKNRVAIWAYCLENLVPGMKPWGYGAGVPPYLIGSHFGYALQRGIHNTYLNMFLEFGYIGLPVFVLLLVRLVRRSYISNKRETLALIVGIIIIAFFLDSYPRTYFWNVLTYCSISTRLSTPDRFSDTIGED